MCFVLAIYKDDKTTCIRSDLAIYNVVLQVPPFGKKKIVQRYLFFIGGEQKEKYKKLKPW
jgi:hypothetical protein